MGKGTFVLAVAFALLFACNDATGPEPPTGFAIVEGDGQAVRAGRDSLLAPVVGQAFEDENGRVVFRAFGAARLHAQVAIGTGVPNVLTCATPLEDGLTPYIQCARTGRDGFVRYWFQPGTVATDSACAEIRAEVGKAPAVVAVTCSVVNPGLLEWLDFDARVEDAYVQPGDTVDLRLHIADGFRDAHDEHDNDVPLTWLFGLPDSVATTHWYDPHDDATHRTPDANGWIIAVPDTAGFTSVPWEGPEGGYVYAMDLWLSVELVERFVGRWFVRTR